MSFTYAEIHGAGHHVRHRNYDTAARNWLTRSVAPEVKPLPWDDVSNWRGKTVWGWNNGKYEQLYIVSRAPEGNEGERWYVQLAGRALFSQLSIYKAHLTLAEKPVTCKTLATAGIKTRRPGRALMTPTVIYL